MSINFLILLIPIKSISLHYLLIYEVFYNNISKGFPAFPSVLELLMSRIICNNFSFQLS